MWGLCQLWQFVLELSCRTPSWYPPRIGELLDVENPHILGVKSLVSIDKKSFTSYHPHPRSGAALLSWPCKNSVLPSLTHLTGSQSRWVPLGPLLPPHPPFHSSLSGLPTLSVRGRHGTAGASSGQCGRLCSPSHRGDGCLFQI